jgi:hypothetical protein
MLKAFKLCKPYKGLFVASHYILFKHKKEIEMKITNNWQYQMLDRLKQDCEYFLGNGNGHEKHLWALSVEEHVAEMKKIWHSFSEKPEWLSLDEINAYERKMLEIKRSRKNV